ncbi:GGDEF domain-containing protein [Hyphomicrobium sp.]|uniref:GGDEF domain-containing protein n=1 Tax=Hyphomicrobium sp. TaxID=82 RepID=UPI0025C4DA97|nr:GGDEF domain-containing protein [Hyphomicrobium sp.]
MLAICGVWLLALLAVSDIDLALLRTSRAVTESGETIVETRYNSIGILVFGVLAAASFGGGMLLARFALPFIQRTKRVSSDEVASASETLGRELANSLAIIRASLATKEVYARSLASAQTRLAGLTEAEQVRVIVSLLIAENERMRLAIVEDKGKIEACAREIEALQASLRGAEEAALTDPLTAVGNRRHFDTVMARVVQDSNTHQTPLSLIMCDIDHFKRVNDMFGHHIGDEIIRALAGIIKSSVRETDTVARYGGEEFAIILPMTEQQVAIATAERIRDKFGAKRFAVRETNQKIGQVTASFGVAEHRPGDAAETFVQRADAKLYEAKAGGRDRVADPG